MHAPTRPLVLLGALTAVNFLNYVDRQILYAVFPAIAADLSLSDARLGFLGSAFIVVYMVATPLAGALGDRGARLPIVAAAVALWSAATAAAAAARGFGLLLVSRSLVGIGEATYAPVSTALIADAYPHGRRSFALAVFNLAVPVGSALGYVLGGIVAELWGWRAAFLIVGTPGIALAGLFLLLREPPRSAPAPHGIERGSVSALLRDPVFVLTTLGMAALTFVLGALAAWMPTFLVRVHGLSMSRAAITFGLVTAATGVVGTALGGWLGDRAARSHPAGPLRVSGFGLLAAVPFAWAAVAADEPFVFWTATAVAETLVFLNTGPLSAVVASAAASEIRASAVAWNILAIHLLGDALSPWLVGALSDAVGLRAALGVMPPMLLASGLLCLAAGRRLRAAAG